MELHDQATPAVIVAVIVRSLLTTQNDSAAPASTAAANFLIVTLPVPASADAQRAFPSFSSGKVTAFRFGLHISSLSPHAGRGVGWGEGAWPLGSASPKRPHRVANSTRAATLLYFAAQHEESQT